MTATPPSRCCYPSTWKQTTYVLARSSYRLEAKCNNRRIPPLDMDRIMMNTNAYLPVARFQIRWAGAGARIPARIYDNRFHVLMKGVACIHILKFVISLREKHQKTLSPCNVLQLGISWRPTGAPSRSRVITCRIPLEKTDENERY